MRGGGVAEGGGAVGAAGRATKFGTCDAGGAGGTTRGGVAMGEAELTGGRGEAAVGTGGRGTAGVTG
jgi:hypothetical protein